MSSFILTTQYSYGCTSKSHVAKVEHSLERTIHPVGHTHSTYYVHVYNLHIHVHVRNNNSFTHINRQTLSDTCMHTHTVQHTHN